MATITLDYDIRNIQARKTLEYILSLGFFKSRQAEAPVQKETVLAKRKKLDSELSKYQVDLSGFRFNRDEANDYE